MATAGSSRLWVKRYIASLAGRCRNFICPAGGDGASWAGASQQTLNDYVFCELPGEAADAARQLDEALKRDVVSTKPRPVLGARGVTAAPLASSKGDAEWAVKVTSISLHGDGPCPWSWRVNTSEAIYNCFQPVSNCRRS